MGIERRGGGGVGVSNKLEYEQMSTSGKRAALAGGGVLLGDDDNPLPSMFGTMMQY